MVDIIFPDGTKLSDLAGGGGSTTGTDNESFTIDQDNIGPAVETTLVFNGGSDTDATIKRMVNGDLKITIPTGQAIIFKTV